MVAVCRSICEQAIQVIHIFDMRLHKNTPRIIFYMQTFSGPALPDPFRAGPSPEKKTQKR